jgi:ribosomal protein L31E
VVCIQYHQKQLSNTIWRWIWTQPQSEIPLSIRVKIARKDEATTVQAIHILAQGP